MINLNEFIKACLEYNQTHDIDITKLEMCPIHVYASKINKACFDTVQTIKDCPVCHKPMCPVCGNHRVSQLSRVTGYVGEVGGWNAAKQQELKDRKRYNI